MRTLAASCERPESAFGGSAFLNRDLQRLREVGFDDRAILQINMIANWFNYINRVADGLGVGK